MLMNKKGDLAVTLLVFMTVALVLGTSFIFASDLNKIGGEIADAGFLNEIYIKEGKLDFYIQEAMDYAGANSGGYLDNADLKDKFITNFNSVIEQYRKDESLVVELSKVEEQANNVRIEGDKIILEINFNIDCEGDFNIIYSYNRRFQYQLLLPQ